VTVTVTREGFTTGSAPVTGSADAAVPAAPTPTPPGAATITKFKLKYKKSGSSATFDFSVGSTGNAPIVGARLVCKQAGSKTTITAIGRSASTVTVKKLKDKKTYSCTVAAANALYVGAPSPAKKFKVKAGKG